MLCGTDTVCGMLTVVSSGFLYSQINFTVQTENTKLSGLL